MFKRILISLFCIAVIIGTISCSFLFLYFAIPSRKAMNSIELPSSVEDTVREEEVTTEEEEEKADTYIADVYQSLTLRETPNSGGKEIASLPPMTHMEILNYVDGTNYAYVEVTTGDKQGYKGYVNTDYITRLGEPAVRVGTTD